MAKPLRSNALADSPALPASPRDAPFEMRRISRREDWGQVRALRFEALRGKDEIPESADRSYGDDADAALNTLTFLLGRGGRAVGSTRSSVSSANRRWRLPAMAAFENEIATTLGSDATIVEASLMVVDPRFADDPKDALFHLFKAHMLHCAIENADWLIAAVRDSQIGFYRRVFNMEILSGAETYPGLATPRVLMGFVYRDEAPVLFKRMPVLAVSELDEQLFAASGHIAFPEAMPARRGASSGKRDPHDPDFQAVRDN